MSFEIGTVIVIGIIYTAFFIAAHYADRVVEAKAAARRQAAARPNRRQAG